MRRFHFPLGYIMFAGLLVAVGILAFIGLNNASGTGYAGPVEDEMVVVRADEALDRVAADPVIAQAFLVRYRTWFDPGPWRDAALKAFRRHCRECAELQFRDQLQSTCSEEEIRTMARKAAVTIAGSGAADEELVGIAVD